MARRGLMAMIAGAGVVPALLAWIAADVSAAQRSLARRCPGVPSVRCAHFHVPAKPSDSRISARRPKRFRGDESTVGQLPGHLRSTRALALEDPCVGVKRRFCRARQGLPDILLSAPTPSSAQALEAYGIPAFSGVPPIVILHVPARKDDDPLGVLTRPGGQ
jgi:hypothetical protein